MMVGASNVHFIFKIFDNFHHDYLLTCLSSNHLTVSLSEYLADLLTDQLAI